jgi:hypothetical protein
MMQKIIVWSGGLRRADDLRPLLERHPKAAIELITALTLRLPPDRQQWVELCAEREAQR